MTRTSSPAIESGAVECHLTIDWTRCDGHGLCARLAPGAIGSDPWGFPILRRDLTAAAAADVRRAVALCPSLALREER